jgi:hypothetical protein
VATEGVPVTGGGRFEDEMGQRRCSRETPAGAVPAHRERRPAHIRSPCKYGRGRGMRAMRFSRNQ